MDRARRRGHDAAAISFAVVVVDGALGSVLLEHLTSTECREGTLGLPRFQPRR